MSPATLTPGPAPVPPPAAAVGPTAADLLALIDRLGGVPASRVRMWPVPGTATKADAVHSELWYGAPCELVDGTLVEKPMGLYESGVAIDRPGDRHVRPGPATLGLVGGARGMYSVVPDQVRMPDVSFTRWARMPADYPANPAPDLSPDLAVEVLSPSNTPREIERKRRNYFAGGTRLVWVFDPPTRTVAVYTPDRTEPTVLTDADTLDGADVLPGFTLAVGGRLRRAAPARRRRRRSTTPAGPLECRPPCGGTSPIPNRSPPPPPRPTWSPSTASCWPTT